MKAAHAVIAQVTFDQMATTWKSSNPFTREVVTVLSAAVAIGLLAVFWAVFIRKRKGEHRHRHHHHHRASESQSSTSVVPGDDSSGQVMQKRHRRRRRREHRPRNPTLAETGGLPPIRPDEPSQSVP